MNALRSSLTLKVLLSSAFLLLACERRPYPVVAQLNTLDPEGAMYSTPRKDLPTVSLGPPTLRVLIAGDFHEGSFQRAAVLRAMARDERERPFDLALILGDAVDECGPNTTIPGARACRFSSDGNTIEPGFTAPFDPEIAKTLDNPLGEMLAAGGGPIPPVYVILGNHDVATGDGCSEPGLGPADLSRLRACLEVAHRTPTWRMPARHYFLDFGPARFIALDSNLLDQDYGGFKFEDELAFMREAATVCSDRPCFILTHHPPASVGPKNRVHSPRYYERIAALEKAANGRIAAWLSGHHHDEEHLRTPSGKDAFVSGSVSTSRDLPVEAVAPEGSSVLFFSSRWGFATLEFGSSPSPWWAVRFEDTDGTPLHCCVSQGGPCEPVACSLPQKTWAQSSP